MRTFFIFLSKSKWLQNIFTKWPYAWKIASRFVAGTTVEEAIKVVKRMNEEGFVVTLDHLGEKTDTQEAANEASDEIVKLIYAIDHNCVFSNVSIKLSQIGLELDKELCRQNLRRILQAAKDTGNFIRIDMEDSRLTDATLEMLSWARAIYTGVGIVIQSYLFRSAEDVQRMLDSNITMRIVKGAYLEPYSISFRKKQDVDMNFDHLVKLVLEHPAIRAYQPSREKIFPAFLGLGTHDEDRIQYGLQLAKAMNADKHQMEIQMLYGIRKDLQSKYVKSEFPVRLYIPFGAHWFPYFMRRLAERPANVWFFVSNFIR